jgi:hypothetical protein
VAAAAATLATASARAVKSPERDGMVAAECAALVDVIMDIRLPQQPAHDSAINQKRGCLMQRFVAL